MDKSACEMKKEFARRLTRLEESVVSRSRQSYSPMTQEESQLIHEILGHVVRAERGLVVLGEDTPPDLIKKLRALTQF